MEDKALDSYIEKISAYIKEKNGSPDKQQLREIALELGFAEADVKGFEVDLDKRKALAFGYLRHGLVTEAKIILDELRILFPDDHGLDDLELDLLFRLWQQTRFEKDKKKFSDRIRELSALNPSNEKALGMLERFSRMEKNTRMAESAVPANRLKRQAIMGAVIIVLGIVFWGTKFGFFDFNKDDGASETTASDGAFAAVEDDKNAIRTEFSGDGFSLDIWESEISRYNDSFSVSFNASLTHPGLEINQIDVAYELYLKNGELYKKNTLPVSIAGGKNIPGDGIPIYFYLLEKDKKDPGLGMLKIIVRDVKGVSAERLDYPGIDLVYDKTAYTGPEHDIKLKLQSVRLSQGLDETYAYIHISIVNEGKRPVKTLKLEAVWHDAEGKQVALETVYGVPTSLAPILPGKSRTLFMIPSWPKNENVDPASMVISVLELE